MHLTQRTDFGLRLLLYLAAWGGRASVGTVAGAFGISETHLAKVAQTLVKSGFVVSTPGRSGGLELARPPEEIRVGEVVRALEPLELVECMGPENRCPVAGACGLEGALARAAGAFVAVLDGVTLAEAARDRRALRTRLGVPG